MQNVLKDGAMRFDVPNGAIVNGDCLQIMPVIPAGFFDLAITSPPYNMNLRIRNGEYVSRQIVKELSTKYTNLSDNLTMEEWYNFNVSVLDELLRVSKLVIYNVQMVTGNKPALFELFGHYHNKIKEVVIWDKMTAQPAMAERTLNSQYEYLIFLSNDSMTRQFETGQFKRGTMSNLIQCKRERSKISGHGAVFPTELITQLITSFSKEGDKIFDPMAGSGTVAIAANRTNRKFFCIEQDLGYFCGAVARINTECNQ